MIKIARESGLDKANLYKALKSSAKPRFETILGVLNTLGVTITFSTTEKGDGKKTRHKTLPGRAKTASKQKMA
ncbi:MAG: hypothetical protein JXA18_09940 [Chitinispirillaceae bacterium]|nr:hypothetical protein [Chitinispirillaceae bacterium]